MLLWEIIRVAFGALRANKVRALLTMLGIIIGVASVIAMMAIGEGAKRAAQEQIASIGVNQLIVEGGTRVVRGTGRDVPLTVDDAWALSRQMTQASAVVPEMLCFNYQVKYRDKNVDSNVDGTRPAYFAARRMKLAAGRIFTDAEVDGRRLVAVLSDGAMQKLGGGSSMVGDYIRIRGIAVEVVGVLKRKGIENWQPNPDEMIFIPVTTAQYRLAGSRYVWLWVEAVSSDRIIAAAEEIERVLRRQHRLRRDQDNDFRIMNMAALLQTFTEVARIFSLLLASVAAISLVVGGIGIMNIMFASVTERTREIGIRKAVGATRTAILTQFVLEAVVLCVSGGAVGAACGYGVGRFMSAKAGWATIVTPESLLLGIAVSVGVGLFFGIYPAFRASRLDPVEALRYE